MPSIIDRFNELTAADQLGLLYDSWALGEAAVGPIEAYLDLTRTVSPSADSIGWRQIIDTLVAVDSMYSNGPNREDFRAYARSILNPMAQQTLMIALGDEPVKTLPKMIARVAVNNPDLAWRFALDHRDILSQRLDEQQRHTFVPSLTAQATNPSLLDELRRFIESNVPEASRKKAEKFAGDLEFRLKVIKDRVPKIDQWLASKAEPH